MFEFRATTWLGPSGCNLEPPGGLKPAGNYNRTLPDTLGAQTES